MSLSIGNSMYELAKRLWPINRSLTGDGVRKTLNILCELLPKLTVHEVPSGTHAFDWTVPEEWNIQAAWVENELGQRVIDFQENNLHVVGYSEPVDRLMSLDELQPYLYSLPDQPNAIPYITSYYSKRWGFCLAHKLREKLKPGIYRVVIKSEHKTGVLNYGELIIPGKSKEEIFLSTYICHPSMANNEISGIVVTAALAQWLASLQNRFYTYRIIFIPETIGSIVYINKNLNHLKANVIAGFNVTCIGDDRCYSYLPSRAGNTLSDRAAKHVLKYIEPDYKSYTWLDRGSDERQYCSPGVDLPIATISRSIYYSYPEYHTSLDDLSLISPSGLSGGFRALQMAIEAIEIECVPKVNVLCEPQLGKRGLYPLISTASSGGEVAKMMNFISYCDGSNSLLEIADIINVSIFEIIPIFKKLNEQGLIGCK